MIDKNEPITPSLRVMVIDDEPISQQTVINYLSEYENIVVCAKAFSIEEAKLRLRAIDVDAVFLDVELGTENGFDLAAYIRKEHPEIAVIFVTGHMELAINGYDYEPLDYLVKPVDPVKIKRSVERLSKALLSNVESKDEAEIILETATGSYFVPAKDILYCELRNRKVYIGRRNGDEICCTSTIDKMEKLLSAYGFVKVYQSVLVKQSEIASVEKDERGQTYHVKLKTDELIFPVSRKLYYEVKKKR